MSEQSKECIKIRPGAAAAWTRRRRGGCGPYIICGGSPPVAAHRCVSVDTIGGRAGLFCSTFSRSSQFMCVNLDTCCEGEREKDDYKTNMDGGLLLLTGIVAKISSNCSSVAALQTQDMLVWFFMLHAMNI